jgi:trehalose-6-phosphate synthase
MQNYLRSSEYEEYYVGIYHSCVWEIFHERWEHSVQRLMINGVETLESAWRNVRFYPYVGLREECQAYIEFNDKFYKRMWLYTP